MHLSPSLECEPSETGELISFATFVFSGLSPGFLFHSPRLPGMWVVVQAGRRRWEQDGLPDAPRVSAGALEGRLGEPRREQDPPSLTGTWKSRMPHREQSSAAEEVGRVCEDGQGRGTQPRTPGGHQPCALKSHFCSLQRCGQR